MAKFKVPPRIAFSDPISGSSLSVSQTMSLGSVAGSAGAAAAAAGLASSAAKMAALPAGSSRAANMMAVRRCFMFELPSPLLIFGKALWIEGFANGLADEYDQDQRNGNGS